MKFLRSLAAVIVGAIVTLVCIMIMETINGLLHPPPDGKGLMEFGEEMQKGTPAAKAWMQSIPIGAMVLLQIGWSIAGMIGGAVAAWIAGWARLLHAGIMGVFVLLMTITNLQQLKELLEYTHPDWLLVLALLLPLPLALLGGLIVARLSATPQLPAPEQA
jgi:hypothetical protein